MSTEAKVTPFNPKNILLMPNDVRHFMQEYDIDVPFRNLSLYRCAMVHKSYCTRKNENFMEGNVECPENCLPLQEESYEVLEFVGDAVLNKVVATYLVERYPGQNEGFYTRTRTKIVNGKMLAKLSRDIGLPKFVIISQQIEESDGRNIYNILEDVLEAFIGAMFTDLGDAVVSEWIINMLETHIDFADLIRQNNNFKDILIKYFQANMGYVPRFVEADVTQTNHHKVYKVMLKNQEDNVIAIGTGNSKKEAENDAAKAALEDLCIEYNNS